MFYSESLYTITRTRMSMHYHIFFRTFTWYFSNYKCVSNVYYFNKNIFCGIFKNVENIFNFKIIFDAYIYKNMNLYALFKWFLFSGHKYIYLFFWKFFNLNHFILRLFKINHFNYNCFFWINVGVFTGHKNVFFRAFESNPS